MYKCYDCGDWLITENESVEHIIPNAIGGRLKSKKLLCKKCNTKFGETIDAEFAKQLDTLCALFSVKRDRNKEYVIKNAITDKGDRYHLVDGLIPIPVKPTIEIGENNVYVSARNEKEIKHILKKLKEKLPTLDLTDVENKLNRHQDFMDEAVTMNISVGGETFLKAVAKIAINAYLHFNGKAIYANKAISFINNKIDNNNIVHWYYPENSLFFENDEVSHLIHLKGCVTKKILYVYLVLFSAYGFIVNLSDCYDDAEFCINYTYDVVKNTKIERSYEIDYNGRLEGDNTILNRRFIEFIQNALDRVLKISHIQQSKATISDIAKESVYSVLEKYPEGTVFNEEMSKKIIENAAYRIARFLEHLRKK